MIIIIIMIIIVIMIILIIISIEWRPKADLAAEGPNLAEGPNNDLRSMIADAEGRLSGRRP